MKLAFSCVNFNFYISELFRKNDFEKLNLSEYGALIG